MKVFSAILLFVLFSIQPAGAFAAGQELMSLDEVEALIDASPNKEVNAYFMSVPRGSEMRRYDIILRGVLRQPGRKIIAFVTREKIVAGMSGSPVYVDGKLIGALALSFNGFNFSDYAWGGISSISLMQEEADISRSGLPIAGPVVYNGMLFEPIEIGYESISDSGPLAAGKFVVTKNSAGSAQASVPGIGSPTVLKAGMPIIVDLLEWTDENGEMTTMSALGTVTYVGGDGRVFAFGHPLLDVKKAAYNFRTAEVMGTVFSESGSSKLPGKRSEVLGTIVTDSTYGIYGFLGRGSLYERKLHNMTLEFKMEDRPFHSFKIKVADSILTPILAQAAFISIGRSYGAPIPQEKSVTQIETKIDLSGYETVVWKEIFASSSFQFGTQTVFVSSYDAAHEKFFSGIYGNLFASNYNFRITGVSVLVNFTPGQSRVFKLGAYKFPNKVVWGQDPVLEILLVSQDNTALPLVKRIPVRVEWDKVEKPVYSRDAMGVDKVAEKTVWGLLTINSSESFIRLLSGSGGSEKRIFLPDYFLGPEDFLENFSRRLGATNQKIFARVSLKSRSGLFDQIVAEAADLIPNSVSEGDNEQEWQTIRDVLTERKQTVKDEGVVYFSITLPPVPNGYVVDQGLSESLIFEVVTE